MEFLQDAVDFYRQKTVGVIKSDSIVEYLFQVNFFIEPAKLREKNFNFLIIGIRIF